MSAVASQRPRIWTSTRVHGSNLPDAEAINPRIQEAFRGLTKDDFTRRTHFFGGRYENLYVQRTCIPEMAAVLAHIETCAQVILARGGEPLRIGFWFNAQGPGQSTTEHTHDEYDELLSGVYYVSAPPESGDLILVDGVLTTRVTPVPGMFLFFSPALAHRVEPNRSSYQRLSVGFNVGPAEDPY
jgi:hypothetical protein